MPEEKIKESTGFRCWGNELFVGDVLSVGEGYYGFVQIEKRGDEYWLTEWQPYGPKNGQIEDQKMDRDLRAPYCKVDPNDPYAEPPCAIYCDQCGETIIGYADVEGIDITWNEDCASHYQEERKKVLPMLSKPENPYEMTYLEIGGICKACAADPTRKRQISELEQYFNEKYEKAGFRVIHIPVFVSKEEIDDWFAFHESLLGYAKEEF